MKLSDFLTSTTGAGQIQATAGTAVNQNDDLNLGWDGKVYPVQVTDYAAVANAASVIVASTSVFQTAGSGGNVNFHRDPQLELSDGSTVFMTPNETTNGYGCKISRYSAKGDLLCQQVLDSSATICWDNHLIALSNGDIVAAFVPSNGAGQITFCILNAALNFVKTATTVEQPGQEGQFDMCALTAGGFALTHHSAAAAGVNHRLAIFDNAGAVVSAPTTICTYTGASNNVYSRIGQLSNGNIMIAAVSQYSGSFALHMGIYSVLGAAVLVMASIGAVAQALMPEISIMPGFFAIARGDNTNGYKAYVYNNAGALQGAAFAPANALNNNGLMHKIVNDGSAFWAIWNQTSDNSVQLTKLPTTGTGYASTKITASTSNYYTPMDAFYERGMIVIGYAVTAQSARWYSISIGTTTVSIVTNATLFGTAPSAGSYGNLSIIPGGDYSFIGFTIPSSGGTGMYYTTVKYANSAILGVALAGAAAGVAVPVQPSPGVYPGNALKGSPTKSFDHTATNILGNKGVILNGGGLILKGMV